MCVCVCTLDTGTSWWSFWLQGMRIVRKGEDFQQLLEACRSESLKSFGDDKVLIEKYLVRPRLVSSNFEDSMASLR